MIQIYFDKHQVATLTKQLSGQGGMFAMSALQSRVIRNTSMRVIWPYDSFVKNTSAHDH